MEIKDYLAQNYREEIPAWLKKHERGKKPSLKQFLDSRTVFYPGSRSDFYAVREFGFSHSAHCFIYVDYKYPKGLMFHDPSYGGLDGYFVLDEIYYSQQEMEANVRWTTGHLNPEEQREAYEGCKRFSDVEPFGEIQPYSVMYILERNPDRDDDFGPKRIALLFIAADGVATFDAFFGNKNATNFFGMLIKDHGFGCNYSVWENGGLCSKIAKRTNSYPELIIAHCRANFWPGYSKIPGAEEYGGAVLLKKS